MNPTRIFLPAVCLLPLLSSCASYQTAGETWSIKPFASVRNSADKPEAFYQLGRYYQGQKRYDQAIAAYRKALALDDGFAEALNGLGVIYATLGKYDGAIEAFKTASQKSPDASHIFNNLGYAYYLQGTYGEAVVALERATALDPDNRGAFNNLGLAYAKAGEAGKSLQAFTQAAKAGSSPTVEEPTATLSDAPLAGDPAPAAATVTESAQVLSLPKDRGVIAKSAAIAKLVEVSPSVYELRSQNAPVQAPVQAAAKPSYAAKKFNIEISNGNGVTGMAKKVAKQLRDGGLPVTRITNQKPFRVEVSQIQYRNGYQAEALRLSSSMPSRPTPVRSENLRIDTDVRLTLGKDAAANPARFVKGNIKADAAAS
ncbi:MAG: LytR C-terminal domain-containing protein [Sulfuricella sp.]|nr:LytR C-terminal domain-containing protein [Sulfuricella sp.]